MSDVFGDELPFGHRNPWQSAITRSEVDPPTVGMLEDHREKVDGINGEGPDTRVATIGSVEAGLRESAVETFDVPTPTAETLDAHRAEVARNVGETAVDKPPRRVIIWEAIRDALKGRAL